MKRKSRKAAISTTIFSIVIVVVLVVAAAAGYLVGSSNTGAGATQTITTTVGGSGGTTVTTTVSGTGSFDQGAATCIAATGVSYQLYEQAKTEGVAVVYAALDEPIMAQIIAAFNQVCPGIQVQDTHVTGGTLINKVMLEVNSSNEHVDLVQGDVPSMNIMEAAGAFQQFTPPFSNIFPPSYQGDGYLSPINRLNSISIVYNNKSIPDSQAPKNLTDLLNPAYKGKLVIADPALNPASTDWFYSVQAQFPSQSAWESWVKGLGAQNPLLVSSVGTVADDIVAGTAPVGLVFAFHVTEDGPACGCLNYVRLNTYYAPGDQFAIGVHAPHPAAGKVFESFLMGVPAQQIIANSGSNVGLPWIPVNITGWQASFNVVPATNLNSTAATQWGTTLHTWLTGG